MFQRVHTVAVYASDLERSRRFYVETLGFEERVQVAPHLTFLRAPGGNINVYLEGGHAPAPVPPEGARLGFFLETDRPVPEVFEAVRASGARVTPEEPEEVGDGIFTFRVEDPDGLLVDVCGPGA